MTPEKLRALMVEHDLNAKKTASLAYVSTSAIYMWLRGERPVARPAWELLLLGVQKPGNQGRLLLDGRGWTIHP